MTTQQAAMKQQVDADLLAIIRRIRRKADLMVMDASGPTGGSTRQNAEEIRLLAIMAEDRLGGEHA